MEINSHMIKELSSCTCQSSVCSKYQRVHTTTLLFSQTVLHPPTHMAIYCLTLYVKQIYMFNSTPHHHHHLHTHCLMSSSTLTVSSATSESLSRTMHNNLSCKTHLRLKLRQTHKESNHTPIHLKAAGEEFQMADKILLLIQLLQRQHRLHTHTGLL